MLRKNLGKIINPQHVPAMLIVAILTQVSLYGMDYGLPGRPARQAPMAPAALKAWAKARPQSMQVDKNAMDRAVTQILPELLPTAVNRKQEALLGRSRKGELFAPAASLSASQKASSPNAAFNAALFRPGNTQVPCYEGYGSHRPTLLYRCLERPNSWPTTCNLLYQSS